MAKQKTLLYLPSIDFNFLTQLPQQILMRFARNGWKVIYCNTVSKDNPIVNYMEEVEPNLIVCKNVNLYLEILKQSNEKIDVVLFSVPQLHNVVKEIKAKIKMFYLLDHFDHWKVAEKEAFAVSDIVLTTADYLYRLRKDEYNHPYFYTVKNGVPEYYLTHEIQEPKEFKNLPRPIVGFIGALGSWTDTRLIRKVAEKYTTVFIGASLERSCPSNVIDLGYKDNKVLADYYGSIDVGLIPFKTTGLHAEITKASCPIKLFEYMGMGTPCVTTDWDETNIYPDIVFSSKDDDEFMMNIEKAISLNKSEYKIKAREEAQKHTWEVRYKEIEDILNKYCENENVRLG
jgi:teichuronic acid biosynthesis glycosyltransferase TuaH